MGRHRHAPTANARELRARQTESESLLWYVLRGRRLGGLKFRRQHPLGPFIADFACVEKKLVVEIDGGYHDAVYEDDLSRQRRIEALGWTVLRLSNEEVLEDVESVARAICRHLGIETDFTPPSPNRENKESPSPQPSPPNQSR